jgi:general L-amino acid transport system substrate-binding protein
MTTLAILASSPAVTQGVTERVEGRGQLRCGVDATPGFHEIDGQGRPKGFDADFCRALAAAVLGSAEAIETVRVSTRNKFEALVKGEIDVAFGQTTWTMGRDTALGVAFPVWNLLDAQGFLTWVESGVTNLAGLAGRRVCVQSGTTSESNLRDALTGARVTATLVAVATSEEKNGAFQRRACDVVTGDRIELAAFAAALPDGRAATRLFDETISREPLGPVVVGGDKRWFDIVRWTVNATLVAEARGVTREIARDPAKRAALTDPEARRLVGLDGSLGAGLGLGKDWGARALAAVGNYAEIFDRNLGSGSPLGLPRGQNALWRDGGLLLPPPMR